MCRSYQQSAIAHAYVDSVTDVKATYDMCRNGTGAQCRSYFVIRLLIHGYATHVIFDDYKRRHFMFMDYIMFQGVTQKVAEQMMLWDLEHGFCKSNSFWKKLV